MREALLVDQVELGLGRQNLQKFSARHPVLGGLPQEEQLHLPRQLLLRGRRGQVRRDVHQRAVDHRELRPPLQERGEAPERDAGVSRCGATHDGPEHLLDLEERLALAAARPRDDLAAAVSGGRVQ